ncbi:MAG: DMT family transporter [Dehalococcoidia bacterium]|jgi:drug/metabolite transporter (DMT)-like permease|nr:DMT family transporter [Dehalococcoidia bacterium]
MANIERRPLTVRAGAFAVIVGIFWSGNSIAIKAGLDYAGPLRLGWMRFVAGSLVILAWAIYTRADIRIRRSEVKPLVALGLLFSVQIVFMNLGIKFTTAGHALSLNVTTAIWTALLAHFFIAGDRLEKGRFLGILVAYAGIVVISLDGLRSGINRDILIGDAFALISAFLLASRQIFAARLVEGMDPNKILLSQFFIGTVIFVGISAAFETEPWSWAWELWTSMAYQGLLIAGFGFIASLWLVSHYFPSRLAALGLLSPVSGIILAWIVLGEDPTSNLWIGAFLVMVGAGLAQRRNRAPKTTTRGAATERQAAD